MKIIAVQLISLFIILSVFLTGCNTTDKKSDGDNLVKTLNHYSSKPDASIDFRKETRFSWDRLYIFPPYTPREEISKQINIKWPDNYETSIEMNDAVNLFIFTNGNNIICYFEYPRSKGDFITNHSISLSPEKAVLNLDEKFIAGERRKIFSLNK